MATPTQQLIPDSNRPGSRSGVLLGLVTLLPVVTWATAVAVDTLGDLASAQAFSQHTSRTLLLVQALALSVFTPWFTQHERWHDGLAGLLLTVMIPLPLLALLWLASPLDLSLLLTVPASAGLYAGLLFLACKALDIATNRTGLQPLLAATVSVGSASLVWIFHSEWLSWLGL